MIQAVPMKKKPTTDGRRSRYQPIVSKELNAASVDLETLAGEFKGAVDDIAAMKLDGARIDGRNQLFDAIEQLKQVSKRIKTAMFEARLDHE